MKRLEYSSVEECLWAQTPVPETRENGWLRFYFIGLDSGIWTPGKSVYPPLLWVTLDQVLFSTHLMLGSEDLVVTRFCLCLIAPFPGGEAGRLSVEVSPQLGF